MNDSPSQDQGPEQDPSQEKARPEPIRISTQDTAERKRRQRNLWLAGGGLLLVVAAFFLEVRLISGGSLLFLALFNLNFILLLLVLYVVVRNTVRLVLERRRKVLGSKLRTKLVVAFMSLSLIPTLVMFIMSVSVVRQAVDYWFTSRVESAMEQALGVGKNFYTEVQQRMGAQGEALGRILTGSGLEWGGAEMGGLLEEKRLEHGLTMIGVLGPDFQELVWSRTPRVADAWGEMRAKVDWESLREQPRYWSSLWGGAHNDFVMGVVPVDEGRIGYLVLGEIIEESFMYKLDQIVRDINEYKRLKENKSLFTVTISLVMGLLALSIVLGAMWFGLRLAKEFTAPIRALALGTRHIARGDLDVRLEDRAQDEFGLLVDSFNRMAEDLGVSRERLTEAYARLERQNKELARRGRYIEAVLDHTMAGVVSLDSQGRISTINRAAALIMGTDPVEDLGRTPRELLGQEYTHFLDEVAEHLAEHPEVPWQRQMDVRMGGQDKKLLVNVVSLADRDDKGRGMVAVFEDITELEKMQRMAAWREVARRIAHEIKNPLTPIKLSAQRLERKFADQVNEEVFTDCTRLIVRQVEQMQQMVQEFSAFAKLPEVVLKPGRIPPLLEELVAVFKNSHSKVRWILEAEDGLPELLMDREALRRALFNLMTNAAEALAEQENGEVVLTAHHEPWRRKIVLTVADNGPGLSSEERYRLFEPYFSRKKGGTGLGLTIVRSIITDHKGSVRAEQFTKSTGLRMVVELPVKSA